MSTSTNAGLLSKIFKNGINWSTILSNTQKTLNIVNQTIPVIKQMGPVMNNAKTMFKLMNEFKKVETPKQNTKKEINDKQEKNDEKIKDSIKKEELSNNPVFFQ
jgi:hypothetical protein